MEHPTSTEGGEPLKSQQETSPEAASGKLAEPFSPIQEISAEIAHFSRLSSELTGFLSNLSQKVQGWISLFSGIQSEIDLKKKELKMIHDIEVSAAALERLIDDQRLRKESFENLMETQRKLWEEEKARHLQEEKQYQENLEVQKKKEEEQYRRELEMEREQMRGQLEAELQALRDENIRKFEEREKECARWERMLKEKELELMQLVEEVEQVMSRASGRLRTLTGPDSNSPVS